MKNLWYTAATTTPFQDRHNIILIKVDEKEKFNFFKGLVFAPPLDAWEPKSDTHGEKHGWNNMRGKRGVSVKGTCLLESWKESKDGKKLQDLGVAGFRVWFGQFLVKSWFFTT